MLGALLGKKSDIVDYVNLVHEEGGLDSVEVRAFREARKGDRQFQARADAFNSLWVATGDILSKDGVPTRPAAFASDDGFLK
jgi:hypothetical protein